MREVSDKATALAAIDSDDANPLKLELYALVRESREIFEFLQDGCLDGLWYMELDTFQKTWVSPRFKEVFGYDVGAPLDMVAWWRDCIVAEDAARASQTFYAHCADPAVPYDEILRYRHKNGGIVWIRCRGLAIRDASGRPVRMLGAHTDITALKEAESARVEALAAQAAQRQFIEIIEGLPQLVWTCDPAGNCDYLSQRWLDYTGVPRALQLGHGWSAQIHPDDRALVAARWAEAVSGAGEFAVEYRLRRHDGVFRWFDARVLPVRDAAGHVTRWLGSSTDVHEARATREELRREQERWSTVVATSPGVVLSFHVSNTGTLSFPYVSPSVHTIFGIRAESLVEDADSVRKRIPDEDLVLLTEKALESARSLAPLRAEFRFEHAESRSCWVSVHFMPTRDAEGGTGWAGVAIDVTTDKMRERELRTLKSQLDAALEAADMGAYVFDVEHSTMWASDTLRRLYGFGPDVPEVHPARLSLEAVHPEDRERVQKEVLAAFAKQHNILFEFRIQRRGHGEIRWMACRARIERGRNGRAVRVVGVAMDVTQQRLIAEAQTRSQKLEALGTLAGGIAHDFNNVLQVIAGRAGLTLAELPQGSQARQHVFEIAHAGVRGSELVSRILSFSRPKEQSRSAIALGSAVEDALGLLRPTIPASVDVRFRCEPEVPYVMADNTEVHRVVVNLVTNAAHAIGRQQGHITLSLGHVQLTDSDALTVSDLPAGSYARLTVSDDGQGMDRGTLARVFDPYFTTKPVGEGTGLGLSVVSSIMRSLGGGIGVRSEIGKGTTFQLYFCEASRESPALSQPVRSSVPRGAGQRVLFVDDEPTLSALGRDILQYLGYTPDAFSDPEKAVAAFLAAPTAYAAVITDLTMPRMSGFDLTAIVRSQVPNLPVVVMSGYARPEEHERADALGVTQFLHKPLALQDLATVLRGIMTDA